MLLRFKSSACGTLGGMATPPRRPRMPERETHCTQSPPAGRRDAAILALTPMNRTWSGQAVRRVLLCGAAVLACLVSTPRAAAQLMLSSGGAATLTGAVGG